MPTGNYVNPALFDAKSWGVTLEQETKYGVNTETLAAAKTLEAFDKTVQFLDPGGTARTVTLPAEASSVGLSFVLRNTADAAEDITVQSDAPATVAVLERGETGLFYCDGTTWIAAVIGAPSETGLSATITLAAGSSNNEMDVTVTVVDANGSTVAAVHVLEIYFSESSAGVGLTADTYSGDLVASTGAILSALTAKKHWRVATAATGIFEATLTATTEPADQYGVVVRPGGDGIVVSAVSGANWG